MQRRPVILRSLPIVAPPIPISPEHSPVHSCCRICSLHIQPRVVHSLYTLLIQTPYIEVRIVGFVHVNKSYSPTALHSLYKLPIQTPYIEVRIVGFVHVNKSYSPTALHSLYKLPIQTSYIEVRIVGFVHVNKSYSPVGLVCKREIRKDGS